MDTTFFLGASTPRGFYSHFDTLFQELRHITILKGGPGCGKSTFLRALGRAAQSRGMEAEAILCSSDPDSLDGIVLPQLSCAFVDGTAPHVLEPKLCGGSMNYLNFGAFYDHEGMAANEAEVLRLQEENAAQYPKATAHLAAAEQLFAPVRQEAAGAAYAEELSALASCLCLSILRPGGQESRLCRRFLSAVTPKGLVLCSATPGRLARRVYVLRDNYGLAPQLLLKLQEQALSMGHRCLACYSPLLPDGSPTHLLLPAAQAALVSDSRDFPYTGAAFCRMDLDAILPAQKRRELDFALKTTHSLLNQAVSHLCRAKALHDRMEQLCHPFVDFSAVDELTRHTIRELFGTS